MKAKEYIDWFHRREVEMGEKRAFAALILRFMEEVGKIAKMRHVISDRGLLSILREQNQKWNAMIKLDDRIKRDGFIDFVNAKMPFIRDAIDEEKARRIKCIP